MSESATIRQVKRLQTERRICRCAQQLTEERGLDGFTLDELAERAEVSRRTLFNYFPSKLDAVLGPVPTMSDEVRATFVAGGPHGDLVNDLSEIARELFESHDVEREDVERAKRVVVNEPRLVLIAGERFEKILGTFTDLIVEREGDRIATADARLLIRLLVAVFEVSMREFVCGDQRPVLELFDENLRVARHLLA
ncbi:TetR family transcriptional regulator [Nocardioides sp. W7]|uniref:TetR/AcrR family transcriptional regulator n=1 Tax=Nocardioides sp. W7 TaxID=2931390 RepID=UPI001FD38E85|nr:TetR family transcriptional regulator [Nocardioides sp. W7]